LIHTIIFCIEFPFQGLRPIINGVDATPTDY
jgi:hypothetical protein